MTMLPSDQTKAQRMTLTFLFVGGHTTARKYRNGGTEWDGEDYCLNGGKCWKAAYDQSHKGALPWEEVAFSYAIDRLCQLAAEGWHMACDP